MSKYQVSITGDLEESKRTPEEKALAERAK